MRLAAAGIAALVAAAFAIPAAAREGPDPEASVPDRPHFGFNDEWAHHADKLPLVERAGADTTRAVISWRVVETERGRFDWSRYDQLAADFRAVGTRPLWVLADAPCWAWTKSETACAAKGLQPRPPRPNHLDDWAVFAAHVAHRYPDAVAIESWNEANLDNFFMPKPDPAKAAELARWANAGVDFANALNGTGIPVLFGGSAPLYETIPEKNEIAYDEFLRAAYAEVPADERGWDGVAMHPFPRFKARDGYLEDIEEHLDAIRAALFDSGAEGTPIWVTEVGLSTAGPFPYSKAEQADGLRRIYAELDAMPDVASIVVHRLIDGPKELRTAESGWGVVRRDLRPKPALCALGEARGKPC
jgi:polysaccharide biosynthesis protein PslG